MIFVAVFESKYADYLSGAFKGAVQELGGYAGAISTILNVYEASQIYKQERERGTSPFWAFGGAVLQTAFYEVFPEVMWARFAASAIPSIAQAVYASYERRQDWWDSIRQPNMGVFFDTEAALTMRQAAVQAIQASKMNARSVLGQEARLMHG